MNALFFWLEILNASLVLQSTKEKLAMKAIKVKDPNANHGPLNEANLMYQVKHVSTKDS